MKILINSAVTFVAANLVVTYMHPILINIYGLPHKMVPISTLH